MGRIAEALKRAERERRQAIATAAGPPPAPVPARPISDLLAADGELAGAAVQEAPTPVVEGPAESLIPFFERSALITEQYRSLRTRLLSQNPNYEHRIIAITSAVPKEGKSVTTLNVGCILAEIRHLKVVVVDGDFRRSSLAHMLRRPNGPGLADVISGEAAYEEVVHETPVPNLSFIPAGRTKGRSAAELLTAASAMPIFRRMQNDYHYTLVDTPPATTVTDVGIIGQMCTGVIVVVRLHRTHEAAAKRAVRLLQVNNIPIVGCLLVGRDAPGARYGYGYGYGHRYHHYREYNNHVSKDAEDA